MLQEFPRRTRIIATIGPACRNESILTELLSIGVDIFRLNLSHGDHETHTENIRLIRRTAAALGRHPGILVDLQGPKIRTGEIEGGAVELVPGGTIAFTPEPVVGTAARVSISYPNLAGDIRPGNRILLDDGLLEVEATAIDGSDVVCRVITGGTLKPRKGVNLPGAALTISPITEKDRKDILFAIDSNVDFIALSFVRTSAEVIELKKTIHEFGVRIPVVCKIEKGEAVENIDEIIDVADALMVARGDLGVETSPEEVPLAQKMIIEKCGIAGKPVIVATQMLDSMINNPRPTRAEATDVANAVYDGADAIMLSGETAAGKYPVEAVAMMDRIARKVERVAFRRGQSRKRRRLGQFSIPDAISHGAALLADDIDARYIVAFTYAGTSAKLISRCRTPVPVLAMTHSEAAIRGLSLYWGIEGILVPEADDTDALMEIARTTLLERNLVQPLDIVVISTGVPLSVSGTTNMVRVLQFPSDKLERRSALLVKNERRYTWEINENACVYCGNCARICSCGIYTVGQKEIHLNEKCLKDCYFDLQCVYSCPVGAIRIQPAD